MRDRLRELNRTMSKAERTLAEPQAKLAELNQKLTAARASGERLAGLQARRREHEISRLLDAPVDEAEVTQLAAEIATATKAFEADREHCEALQIAASRVQAQVDTIQRELHALGTQRPALLHAALLEEAEAGEAEFIAAARAFAKACSKRLLPYVASDVVLQQHPTIGRGPVTFNTDRRFAYPQPNNLPGFKQASALAELDPALDEAARRLVRQWAELS